MSKIDQGNEFIYLSWMKTQSTVYFEVYAKLHKTGTLPFPSNATGFGGNSNDESIWFYIKGNI